mmetsp:Transcript_7822/g.25689  ORF Transcript_7822/g.25689 Transcript_7822/m.25689 type:complete len:239 (-) Transcript_7822:91-807(-)
MSSSSSIVSEEQQEEAGALESPLLLLEEEEEEEDDFCQNKRDGRRWEQLGMYVCLNIGNQMAWVQYTSVPKESAEAFGVPLSAVTALATAFPATYVPGSILAARAMRRGSLRSTLRESAFLMVAGSAWKILGAAVAFFWKSRRRLRADFPRTSPRGPRPAAPRELAGGPGDGLVPRRRAGPRRDPRSPRQHPRPGLRGGPLSRRRTGRRRRRRRGDLRVVPLRVRPRGPVGPLDVPPL